MSESVVNLTSSNVQNAFLITPVSALSSGAMWQELDFLDLLCYSNRFVFLLSP